jgi:hypothetical protein
MQDVVEMQPTNRPSLHRAFVARFRPATSRYRAVPVTAMNLDAMESAIQCRLPASYRQFVTQFGAGENEEPDHPALRISEIWQPQWIIKQVNQPWTSPIPADVTGAQPIASDVAWKHLTPFGSEQSHGHWFCFPRLREAVDDAPVFFFDHDGGAIEQVADGFDDMLVRILEHGAATT